MTKGLKILAEGISLLAHPLLMLSYALIFLLVVNPYLFGASRMADRESLILLVFTSSFVIPMIAIWFMKLLGMVSSLRVPEREERIGPYILVGTLYLWLYLNLVQQADIPVAYAICILGTIIGLFAGFVINIFDKISIHGIAMGAMISYALIVRVRFSYGAFYMDLPILGEIRTHLNYQIPLLIILAGLVLSARLYLGAHSKRQIFMGVLIGCLSQWIALRFLL